MNKADANKRIKELIELLNRASKAYYNEDKEIMPNIEYDRLYDELKNLEDEYDHCINEMGFEYEDLILMNINSIKYSFLPEQDKKRIIAELENCLETLI